MLTVGIRELKNGLSRYLKRVGRGETIVVTDRGQPIARIVPDGTPEHVTRLLADGRATWSGRKLRLPKPIKLPKGAPLASDLISEDRR